MIILIYIVLFNFLSSLLGMKFINICNTHITFEFIELFYIDEDDNKSLRLLVF